MSIVKNNPDPTSLTLYERLADDQIKCDGCNAILLYLAGDASPEQLFEAQVLPLVYRNSSGSRADLHFCSPCQKHQPENVKNALEAKLNEMSDAYINKAHELSESDMKCEDLEVQIAEICEDRDNKIKELQNELKKSEIVAKGIKTSLENLELKLGKLTADDFAARYREPILVVLLQEGEEIIRRFLAGPPDSKEAIEAFTEKLKKWLDSQKKAVDSTTTQRQFKAGETLRTAFNRVNPNKGDNTPQ